jgi:hypothetical protein
VARAFDLAGVTDKAGAPVLRVLCEGRESEMPAHVGHHGGWPEQKPANALLTLHYDNGEKSYEMQQTIPPGEQMLVNVGELIQKRTADRKGNVLPADLGFGTYDVKDLGSGPGGLTVSGVALDKTFGYQSAVQSPDCCGFYGDSLNPDSLEVDISGFQNVGAVGTNQCTGQLQSILGDITGWSSGNTAIAQVASAKVTGVAPGFTTATGTGIMPVCYGNTLYWEPINPTAPVEVGPNQVEPIDTASQGPASCSIKGQAGWVRNVTNQVQFANGAAYAVSGLTVADVISVGTPNTLGISNEQEGQAPTTGDGSFPDTYYVCSSACPGSGASDATQKWTVAAFPLPHANALVYKCGSITIDGH